MMQAQLSFYTDLRRELRSIILLLANDFNKLRLLDVKPINDNSEQCPSGEVNRRSFGQEYSIFVLNPKVH